MNKSFQEEALKILDSMQKDEDCVDQDEQLDLIFELQDKVEIVEDDIVEIKKNYKKLIDLFKKHCNDTIQKSTDPKEPAKKKKVIL